MLCFLVWLYCCWWVIVRVCFIMYMVVEWCVCIVLFGCGIWVCCWRGVKCGFSWIVMLILMLVDWIVGCCSICKVGILSLGCWYLWVWLWIVCRLCLCGGMCLIWWLSVCVWWGRNLLLLFIVVFCFSCVIGVLFLGCCSWGLGFCFGLCFVLCRLSSWIGWFLCFVLVFFVMLGWLLVCWLLLLFEGVVCCWYIMFIWLVLWRLGIGV